MNDPIRVEEILTNLQKTLNKDICIFIDVVGGFTSIIYQNSMFEVKLGILSIKTDYITSIIEIKDIVRIRTGLKW